MDRVRVNVEALHGENLSAPVPIDVVTTSGSGLDPHISPAAAAFQVTRVARERGVDQVTISGIVNEFTEGAELGFLGEPRVNVLLLNLALDERLPMKKQ